MASWLFECTIFCFFVCLRIFVIHTLPSYLLERSWWHNWSITGIKSQITCVLWLSGIFSGGLFINLVYFLSYQSLLFSFRVGGCLFWCDYCYYHFFFGIRNVEFDNLIDIYCIYLFFFLNHFTGSYLLWRLWSLVMVKLSELQIVSFFLVSLKSGLYWNSIGSEHW